MRLLLGKIYDATLQSLANRSHRSKQHPKVHTEKKLIRNMRKYNPHAGLIVFWLKLYLKGYKRSLSELYRILRKFSETRQTPSSPKYTQKSYKKMQCLTQMLNEEVKVVLIVV